MPVAKASLVILAARYLKADFQSAPNGFCGTVQGVQRYRGVFGIQQTIQGGATGVHAPGEFHFGQGLPLHHLAQLPRDDSFDRNGLGILEQAFFAKELGETGSDVFSIAHNDSSLRRASRKSRAGVFCVFLM